MNPRLSPVGHGLTHGPTAGPPPYGIYRLEPSKVLALPGMFGMFETDQSHKPTRWTFAGD